ncbi:DASH complex subunit ask1 [Kickxella alabastrina]|uniref:DASH complex subunit ask1 n=1 Tax=Kickxella alabastrina TaxID=61397 RepID=A0ACC1ILI2_9FUNG|nr:DASH complex subunit ask1 [Kickxella alabastrina]
MSQTVRYSNLTRPDSQASGYGDNPGRFTQALSAAVKREHGSGTAAYSPEEQLEEIEQKITLSLQAIDANFDHCQRTMARDVMPKVEKLARLSGELLEASQPWLQFFMAVAAADDQDSSSGGLVSGAAMVEEEGALDGGEEEIGLAQRVAIEEVAHVGEITARFPQNTATAGGLALWDDDDPADIDADIATPQLTSRFMTQELCRSPAPHQPTPRANALKRMSDQLPGSAKRQRPNTPKKPVGAVKTPVSLMRALVHARQLPGSAVSGNSSSMDTADLMPDSSPPHTTTFTLPKSRHRRIAPMREPTPMLPEEDEDEILGEINSLIRRYDSPRAASVASSRVSGIRPRAAPESVARSDAASSNGEEMRALAEKYASPAMVAEASRVQGLVADMEEMLDEVDATTEQPGDTPVVIEEEDGLSVIKEEADDFGADDFDEDIPSPPQIVSSLEGSRVVIPDIPQPAPSPAPAPARRMHNAARVSVRMEEADLADMTIGQLSPLALRSRMRPPAVPTAPVGPTSPHFHALSGSADADDPFGPTPARPAPGIRPLVPLSLPSLRPLAVEDEYPASTRSWANRAASASDGTATYDHTSGAQLNDSSLTIDAGFTLASMDGTTSILPTREMLQRAAQVAESSAALSDDGMRDFENTGDVGDLEMTEDLEETEETEMPLETVLDLEAFPPAFRCAPASKQLRELYELMRSQGQRIWTLDDLVMEEGRRLEGGELRGVGVGMYVVLLDLLSRRRLVRKISDTLWAAH